QWARKETLLPSTKPCSAQTLLYFAKDLGVGRLRRTAEVADHGHRRALGARRHWPCYRAAHENDEVTPFHAPAPAPGIIPPRGTRETGEVTRGPQQPTLTSCSRSRATPRYSRTPPSRR